MASRKCYKWNHSALLHTVRTHRKPKHWYWTTGIGNKHLEYWWCGIGVKYWVSILFSDRLIVPGIHSDNLESEVPVQHFSHSVLLILLRGTGANPVIWAYRTLRYMLGHAQQFGHSVLWGTGILSSCRCLCWRRIPGYTRTASNACSQTPETFSGEMTPLLLSLRTALP